MKIHSYFTNSSKHQRYLELLVWNSFENRFSSHTEKSVAPSRALLAFNRDQHAAQGLGPLIAGKMSTLSSEDDIPAPGQTVKTTCCRPRGDPKEEAECDG